jgi:hypothetical protein
LIRRTGVIEHQVKTKDIFYRHFYDHLGPDGRLHGSAEKPLNTEVEEPGSKVIASLLDGKAITYPQTRHTIFTAPRGSEFITGDNYVIPLPKESVDDVLAVPFQNSTELLMPLSPNKLLFASRRTSRSPGVSISRKSLPADQVQNVNDIVCTFASAHIFSSNEELLKEIHDRNPFFDGKIVVVGGSEYSYFPYPPELSQTFLQ